MPSVSNLKVKQQTGSTTYYATWDFNETSNVVVSSGFKAGDLVTIKSGATYYNGTSIPSWVMSDSWYLIEAIGDRAVLGRNPSGTHNIVSPINVNYLNGGGTTTVSTQTLDHYEVKWYYDTGDSVWFEAGSSNVTSKQSTYSAPSNALKIQCTVTPVSKTREVNGNEMSYWNGSSQSATYDTSYDPPKQLSTPSVTIEKFDLTASLENISDPRCDQVLFEIYNGDNLFNSGTATVKTCRASFKCSVNAGGKYRARARAINLVGTNKLYGDWSDYTSEVTTIPATPEKITTIRATSTTSIYLEWTAVTSADTYELEYTTKLSYFDGSNKTSSISSIKYNHYEITGLDTGQEYFFRVKAVNSKGDSGYTSPVNLVIGKKPSAPTTWSTTTVAVVGESLNLYWVHNAEDGSSQRYAELELTIGGKTNTYTIKNSTDEDEKDKTSVYPIDTSKYNEGTQILWRVRTAGVTLEYGDWSVQRTVDIYAPPTLVLSVTNQNGSTFETLNGFPFYVRAVAGPNTQVPVGYHLAISSNQMYETRDSVGNKKIVNAGEEIYSKYFDISEVLVVELSASNLDLENDVSYRIEVTVSMNSGLNTSATSDFTVNWLEQTYEPNLEISVDTNNYVAYIRPYCQDDKGGLVENITLGVYRKEFDGSFTEIATRLNNTKNVVVTDPHPALDYARYRIVAIDDATGTVSFYDGPGYPVNGSAVVIQWDEEWSYFDSHDSAKLKETPYAGSMLVLPYNIDVSDSHSNDVNLVKYIGRQRPVAYYGTQLGETSTWNLDIEKSDKETLYGLRRLAIWTGDVYVREPSGSGYWASIQVSFNQKHTVLTIPVTLSITRVEGGI